MAYKPHKDEFSNLSPHLVRLGFVSLPILSVGSALSFGAPPLLHSDPHEMTVMWATKTSNVLSIVEVWPFERPQRKKQFRGSIATLEGSSTIIHTVLVQGSC